RLDNNTVTEIRNETPIVDIKKDVIEDNKVVKNENIYPVQNNQNNDFYTEKLPSAKFAADITEGCLPLPVAFKPAENCDTAVYLWDFGDGNFSNEKSPEYTYKKAGKYQVSLTMKYFITDQVVVKVMDKKIEVFPLPEVSITSSGNEMKYNFTTECDCRNCTWYIDNNTISGSNIYYTFNNVGEYEIKLMCSNDLGCSDSVTEIIEISNDLSIYIPTGFSPDGDGNNDTFGPVLSDQNYDAFSMKVFGPGGQLVYQTDNLDHSWNGKVMNTTKYADTGVYSYEIIIIRENGKTYRRIGHVSLIR
ncbi:MAG: PKD domain-containing protein, partial [Bacteroidota bacterium]